MSDQHNESGKFAGSPLRCIHNKLSTEPCEDCQMGRPATPTPPKAKTARDWLEEIILCVNNDNFFSDPKLSGSLTQQKIEELLKLSKLEALQEAADVAKEEYKTRPILTAERTVGILIHDAILDLAEKYKS